MSARTVCVGPTRRSPAPAVFLPCGAADSDISSGLVSPTCRPLRCIVPAQLCVFICPPSLLPGALQSAHTSVLWSFLDISKVAETERRMVCAPMGVFGPSSLEPKTDVCRQPQRPLNPRKPAAWSAFPAGGGLPLPCLQSVSSLRVSHLISPFRHAMRRT